MRSKLRLILLCSLLAAVAVAAGTSGVRWLRAAAPSLATARVVKGDFEVTVKARGEIKALRSVTLTAPTTVTEVRVVKLAKSGSTVKAGEEVIVIDANQERNRLQEQQSVARQVEAEIEKVRAQARIQNEQDRLDLAQAQFDVERAKLEVSKQEIVSEIEAGKARLALENAERKLVEVQQRLAAHKRSQEAELDQVMQKRKKALGDVTMAQANLKRLTIHSPLAGVLNLLPNWSASSGFGAAPEFKAGDRAWPGAAIAEIPDLASLAVELNIEETDRSQIAAGQAVHVKVEALSDKPIQGKIDSISALSQVNWAVWPPQKVFRAMVKMDALDGRLRPGMSVGTEIVVNRLRGVTLIPVRASFDRGGKVIAYVKNGRRFEPREMVVGRKSETQVEVSKGLQPGDVVALEEPAWALAAWAARGGS